MIRRAMWLTIGAALGIAGYRRATRAAKSLLAAPDMLAPLARRAGAASRSGPAGQRAGASAGAAGFVRDVRAGMAEYLDRHREP